MNASYSRSSRKQTPSQFVNITVFTVFGVSAYGSLKLRKEVQNNLRLLEEKLLTTNQCGVWRFLPLSNFECLVPFVNGVLFLPRLKLTI